MHKLDIKLGISTLYLGLTTGVIAISFIIIGTLPLSLFPKLLLLSATFSYGSWLLWAHPLQGAKHTVQALKLTPDGWVIRVKNSLYEIPVEICGSSTLTSFVCSLRFKHCSRKRRYACVIFRDSMPFDFYRRLLVNIRTVKFS